MRRWIFTLAVIVPATPASGTSSETPDFTGYWQHSPIAEYQPVPGSPSHVLDKKHPINTNNFRL